MQHLVGRDAFERLLREQCQLQLALCWHCSRNANGNARSVCNTNTLLDSGWRELYLDPGFGPYYCYVNHQFPGTFTCLEVVFKFKRRLGYYLFHTYVPTCLIVIMSWISFWIKPEAVPARVTLGVTSLLTLSTQHANSQKSLPPVSYIKVLIE